VQLSIAATWSISILSIVLMLVRPRRLPEYVWICGGAALLLVARLISPAAALDAVLKGTDVYLFLFGMMLLAELARHEGVFDWIADLAMHHARHSRLRLFLLIYLTGTVVTALLSNDATAVVLTPAVLAAVRRARVEPKPYLFACAFIANAASFVLPISNPANLVIYGRHLPMLSEWVRMFALPSVISIVATYFILQWMSWQELRGTYEPSKEEIRLTGRGKLALAGLASSAAVLLSASALGRGLGAPTCVAGLLSVGLVSAKDRSVPLKVGKDVAWGVLALVAGLFVMVEALSHAGLINAADAAMTWLLRQSGLVALLGSALGVAAISNVMNNLPVALASGSALEHLSHAARLGHALLLGVDLGPNLSVTGSLATILWLIALRREDVHITPWEFLRYGLVMMPVALLLSVLAVSIAK
jgi:arsenical pump membrane protein